MMTPELLKKYAAPVPRYTSYPTAPHFTADIGAAAYEAWLAEIAAEEAISLYVHVPYCHQLCWYCGCNTKATQRYEPVAGYLRVLLTEIANVAARLPQRPAVVHMAWGGGSPNILSPDHIRELAAALRAGFRLRADAEFAVEVDPRSLSEDQVRAFADSGVNRLSVGVQDFAAKVQEAINRDQGFEKTRRTIDMFRALGVRSVNIDLVYGLPHQTAESVAATMRQVLELAPDRIALFGYAHLPSRLHHQRLIDEAALPGTAERFAQATRAAEILLEAGYVRIGLDHFAHPSDRLAKGELHRNFQGYTSDRAETLIGLGASAIGRLPAGYVQNAVPTGEYERRIRTRGLATAKGRALTADDRVRGFAIERLMCDLRLPARELEQRFGPAAAPVLAEARAIVASDTEGLVAADGEAGGFRVTEKGRIFVRSIAASFDAYLGQGHARHSAGV